MKKAALVRWRDLSKGLMRPMVYLCLVISVLGVQTAWAKHGLVRVAVASNFRTTMHKLVNRFQKQTNYRTLVSSGSSGKLFAQINHGATFDIFFSADQGYVQKLVNQPYLKIRHKPFTYAFGKLVLVSRHKQLPRHLSESFFMGKKSFVSIANPRFAPYGRAAQQVLNMLNSSLQPLIAENVAQAYQYVYAGHADWGLVAQSLVLQSSDWRLIPDTWYQPILQDAVILKSSPATLAFARFIQGASAKKLIVASGYGVLD